MFSKQELEQALRKALAAALGGLLAFVLLTALLIAGVILLLQAATAGLTPLIGEAGALGVTGVLCFALLGLFFWRLMRPSTKPAPGQEGGNESGSAEAPVALMRRLIRENPLEAMVTAFVVGIVGQGDARARALLLKGSLLALREAEGLKSDPEQPEPVRPEATPPQQGSAQSGEGS